MAQWMVPAPSLDDLERMLALYACTLTLSGVHYTVTHSSGRSLVANDAAGIELARA